MQRRKGRQDGAGARYRSFDVFDTVLTRAVGSPDAVFDVVGRELHESGVLTVEPVVFARARRAAAARAAEVLAREPTLHEVHQEAVVGLGLPVELAEATVRVELEVERRLSRAIPGARARLQQARRSADVVFLSDTHFGGDFVQELLERAGLWEPGDRVFTSADHGARKAAGGALFDLAARALAVRPEQVLHVGDNPGSDVGEALLRGWSACSAPAGRLNRYEELLEQESVASAGVSSYLAGASRLARLAAVEEGVDPALAAVAAGVGAPLLVGFCAWLVRQSQQQGLQRLYFLSRDAEVMLDVFRPVAAAMGAGDLEAHYLYGSRSAWVVPGLAGADPAAVRAHVAQQPGDTARTVLRRVGLDVDDVARLVDDPAVGEAPDRPLSLREQERLADVVGRDPLLSVVRAVATERRQLLLDYLRQEGLAEGGSRTGVVDVGWTGRTFRALDVVMAEAGWQLIRSYFQIGRTASARVWSPADLQQRQHNYLFDELGGPAAGQRRSGAAACVEALCTGSEGSLDGYERRDGRIVPLLVSPANTPALQWGLPAYRATLDSVVTALVAAEAPLSRPGDLRGAADRTLDALWLHPGRREVAVWGSLPVGGSEDHRETTTLASPIRTRDVLMVLRTRQLKLRPMASWRAGTAQVSSPPWRQLLGGKTWYDRHGGRLRRLPHRVRLELAQRRR